MYWFSASPTCYSGMLIKLSTGYFSDSISIYFISVAVFSFSYVFELYYYFVKIFLIFSCRKFIALSFTSFRTLAYTLSILYEPDSGLFTNKLNWDSLLSGLIIFPICIFLNL